MLRCFIAIELPEEIKESLAETQRELQKYGADIRWVRPENIHLTLKFLGDTAEDHIKKISENLSGVCKGFKVFNLEMTGLGVFPGTMSPKVLWAGLIGSNNIIDLQKEIESSMAEIGFKPENRVFSPHLTIGRFRSPENKDALLEAVTSEKVKNQGIFEVKTAVLIKSSLTNSGSVYTKISEALLTNP
ncbi:MAG: RNA 2',3'-cyclic phosphodiesterase [Thermodesulfovibrionia bacterium]|nr:RNA 2',3'-cyclic phosphodiesterase [Thermodesulfovibrionia bacterium]